MIFNRKIQKNIKTEVEALATSKDPGYEEPFCSGGPSQSVGNIGSPNETYDKLIKEGKPLPSEYSQLVLKPGSGGDYENMPSPAENQRKMKANGKVVDHTYVNVLAKGNNCPSSQAEGIYLELTEH